MKLLKYKKIVGDIVLQTGLHIGGSDSIIEIGGLDNTVIKNVRTNEPYIPGSSLKGKMRSLLEWKLGMVSKSGKPHGWKDCEDKLCPICRVFGTSANEARIGPTRLIVRDAVLNKDEKISDDSNLIEEKSENFINRITAEAMPRTIERVVPGVSFSFEIVYRIFDIDGDNGETDEKLFDTVLDGLRYIEQDALGGYGSRGCGQVSFENLVDEDGKPVALPE